MGGKPNKQKPQIPSYKITFLGDGGIGSKTAYIEMLLFGKFKIDYDPTYVFCLVNWFDHEGMKDEGWMSETQCRVLRVDDVA